MRNGERIYYPRLGVQATVSMYLPMEDGKVFVAELTYIHPKTLRQETINISNKDFESYLLTFMWDNQSQFGMSCSADKRLPFTGEIIGLKNADRRTVNSVTLMTELGENGKQQYLVDVGEKLN